MITVAKTAVAEAFVVFVRRTPSAIVLTVPSMSTAAATSKSTYVLVGDFRASQSTLADASSSWCVMQRWFVKSLNPIDALPWAATRVSSTASKDRRTIHALGVPKPAFVKSAVPVPELEIGPLTTATLTSPAITLR